MWNCLIPYVYPYPVTLTSRTHKNLFSGSFSVSLLGVLLSPSFPTGLGFLDPLLATEMAETTPGSAPNRVNQQTKCTLSSRVWNSRINGSRVGGEGCGDRRCRKMRLIPLASLKKKKKNKPPILINFLIGTTPNPMSLGKDRSLVMMCLSTLCHLGGRWLLLNPVLC